MIYRFSFLYVLLLACQVLMAQHDSIALDEVIVTDRQLREFSESQSVTTFNDSVIRANRPALGALLNYNSAIYFKENGPGMVSSASFRGTTAQQTAVVWNGINVNSQFNGQTDFNAVGTGSFNSVAVRSGGGSVVYGSSAIGGTVHLNNDLAFGNRSDNALDLSYGSFGTFSAHYRLSASSENVASQIGISRNSSANDFDVPNDRQNQNGQYENTSVDFGLALKPHKNNLIKILTYAYDGDRHFSLISPSDSRTKYHERNTRLLLEWANASGKLSSNVKAAYLGERYDFFDNIDRPPTNFGNANTLIAKYDGLYAFNDRMSMNVLADFTQTAAKGSDVTRRERQIASVAVLFKHQPVDKLAYEIGIRQEATKNYDSPFLFSAGAQYRFSRHYSLKINGSKNFRIPTFNDLYWSNGGNTDVRPETALQGEIGNVITYKNWKLSVTGFYIDIDDMIQWLPGAGVWWYPANVNAVKSLGLENSLRYFPDFGAHKVEFSATYAYTVSENKQTGHQLIYVPYHKAATALAYSWQRFSADLQTLFCGEVFTRSDNDARYTVDGYAVSNLGLGYSFGGAKLGVRILNLFDENYEVVAGRPFPRRHYNLNLNLKF